MPVTSYLHFCPSWLQNWGVPITSPPFEFWQFVKTAHKNFRKYFTFYYLFIIKDIIKGTNEHPHEDVCRVGSKRTLGTGVSVPIEFGVHHPPSMWMCSPTQKLPPSIHHLKDLWGLHFVGMIDEIIGHGWLNSIPSHSPTRRSKGEAERSNPVITWLVPLATKPHAAATKCPPRVTSSA